MTKSKDKPEKFGVREFFKRFPDENACLEHVMVVLHGLTHNCRMCGVADATFHKITDRRAYACAHCGGHLYPCVGTIFEDSRTPLQIWFYAIFLFVSTRHGVSGRELSRQLGVTVKTGWRIANRIRKLIGSTQNFDLMQGHVELDEAFIGGRRKRASRDNKTIVMGLKERNGEIRGQVIPNTKMETLRQVVIENVGQGSTVSTDEFVSYNLLKGDGYQHGKVNHTHKEYARFDEKQNVVHHVNGVENFWRLFKQSIASTHIHVSPKYMQEYVKEFTFRANHRTMVQGMFDLLIAAI